MREDRVRAHDHVNACRDHRGSVYQSRNRCRAGHSVRQPDKQRYLRTLARSSHKQQYSYGRDSAGKNSIKSQWIWSRNSCYLRKSARDAVLVDKVQIAVLGEDEKHRQREPEVANTVNDKCLLGRVAGKIFEEVVAYQQI